jgi:hypothetical protein
MGKFIVSLIIVLMIALAFLPLFRHQNLTANQKAWSQCFCKKCRTADNEWQKGEFVTLRRIYPHKLCSGQLVFNGQGKPAPYSEKEFFYTHVCDLCGATNQILNATWPQFKQEWRPL